MSGDTKYKDGLTGGNYTYRGTEFKEEGANIRIDKDFSDTENLRIWYNHRNGKDGYPITAPDYRFGMKQNGIELFKIPKMVNLVILRIQVIEIYLY